MTKRKTAPFLPISTSSFPVRLVPLFLSPSHSGSADPYSTVLPRTAPAAGLEGMIRTTVLARVGGAWLILRHGRSVGRAAELLTSKPTPAGLGTRSDEVGTAMKSLTGLLATIDQQSIENNTFAMRL